jgi:hypothetical protein
MSYSNPPGFVSCRLIGMLCLALGNYDRAVVIDPARPASFDSSLAAFSTLFPPGQPSKPAYVALCCQLRSDCSDFDEYDRLAREGGELRPAAFTRSFTEGTSGGAVLGAGRNGARVPCVSAPLGSGVLYTHP